MSNLVPEFHPYGEEFRSPKELCQESRQHFNDYNTLCLHEALDYEIAYLACFAPLSTGLDRTPMAC